MKIIAIPLQVCFHGLIYLPSVTVSTAHFFRSYFSASSTDLGKLEFILIQLCDEHWQDFWREEQ